MGIFTRRVTTKKTARKERKKRTYILIAWMVLIISFVALFVLLLYTPFVRIQKIVVSPTSTLHPGDLATTIQKSLDYRSLWVIPHATWMTLPRKDVKAQVMETYPRVKDISLGVQDFSRLVADVTEWDPEYLWCGYIGYVVNTQIEEDILSEEDVVTADIIPIENRELLSIPDTAECLYVDRSGVVFAEAPRFSIGVYDMFYTTDSARKDVTLSERVLDEELFNRIKKLRSAFSEHGVETSYAVLESHDDMRLGIESINGVRVPDAMLRIHMGMLAEDTIELLQLTIVHENFTKRFIENSDALEYIDVRFDGKILFRFRS